MPPVHGMALQQSESTLQIWPYCEQTGGPSGGGIAPSSGGALSGVAASSGGGPPSGGDPSGVLPLSGGGVTPPSGGGGMLGPHFPSVLPCGTMQKFPGQQSAVTVQLPVVGTQILPPSGTIRQRSCPVSSGTQGTPLQQSPV